MTLDTLLTRLHAAGVRLRSDGGRLVVSAPKNWADGALLEALRGRKADVLELLSAGDGGWWAPPAVITPEMLTLVSLTQAEIDAVVAGVEGGAANVQDIYPLAPLQEGILFHHLMAGEGDPYLSSRIVAFKTRERLDAYLQALQAVIARHDILRTAVAWEGLPEPVQVVRREARMPVAEVELDPAEGDAAKALWARFDPRRHRIDVRRAPLMHAHVARDPARDAWLLLLLEHHLVSDHATQDVLTAEVRAHLEGRADELPPALPFRTYVAQARLGVSREEHEAYFRGLLADVDEPTAPFGLLDAHGDGSGIAEAVRRVEAGLGDRLRKRARELGVSAASVFHVAWAQVLARLTGRDDVVFGTVLLGRMQGGEGAGRVLGLFINTLPVRARLGAAGAEASVRAMHGQLADLLVHEHASLALAQRCSGVQAPAPLFSSFLNYRHAASAVKARAAEGGGQQPGMRGVYAEERTNYPVSLAVNDRGDEFGLVARTPSSVDPARVCAMMHRALEGLVEALETAPALSVARVDVLPDAERAQAVEAWNRTDAAEPALCVHETFEAQAARTPGAVALTFEDRALTYAELNERANRLAHHLRRRGVRPDARVGVCLERSPELMIALLGVMKSGGAYVPLDPGYPEDRIRHMLDDSAPAALLVHAQTADRFSGESMPVIDLDADADAFAAESAENPGRDEVGLTLGDLVYIIYTSGSTGRPKGVMVEHRALSNVMAWMLDAWPLGADDAVLQKTPISFDASARELYPPLLAGARMVIAKPGGHRDPAYMVEIIRREGVTTLHFVPTMFQFLLEEPGVAACTRIARVVCGGEALPAALARKAAELLPGAEVHNVYGPTEAAVDVTWMRCPADVGGTHVSIGRPMDNCRAYFLDAAGRPAPAGVVGELYLGGAQVARGYLGRAALTAERFVPDPFSGTPGARLYRTGDVGRWRADGTIEFLGRNDHQVKVRGFRIELGEIEARLREHPSVREAVVAARGEGAGEARLVAYHVGDDGVSADALREHLAAHLPEYMVPAAYVRLDALPQTPNGKLDRRALPAPDADAYSARAFEAPEDETEAALAEIWSEVLGIDPVGRRDHFFELGGHSLLAVRVLSRVRQVLGAEVALGDVFERPVLADFARGVREAVRAELPPIEPVDRTTRIPLSFAQQRLWFLEQLGGIGGAYHIPRRLRLRGELDRGALVRALDRIVARHEALRTTFPAVDGTPEQRIAPAEESRFALAEHDLSGDADAQAALRRLVSDEADAPFDLERGPLVRGRLIRLAEDDHVLLVTLHHVVSDAWSGGVLMRELSTLYDAFRRGADDPLPPLPLQYADYAAWQRRWVEGEVLERQARYWTETLTGAPELLELPTDRPRPVKQDFAGDVVPMGFDAELTAALKALSRRHGATLFMTLLAGWAVVLSRLSGQDDVVIGTPTANRGRREVEGLIGFFVNTLALRVELADRPTVAALLARVKRRALEAQSHQDIPFEQVVEHVRPARSLSHAPLFQAMFAWQNAPAGALKLPGLSFGGVPRAARETAKFDLSLALSEHDGRIAGGITYATSLFDRETVERHVATLRRVLEEMAADDARTVERIDVLPPAERRLVLDEWNAAAGTHPGDACVHQLLEAQARRTPDAVALVHGGERITYAALDARANRLARLLVERGVGADARVGVCLERTPELVVSILAVHKAGGAYVPLDPAYPRERLGFMLEDAAVETVVTTSALAARLPAEVRTLPLDAFRGDVARRDAAPLPPRTTPENLSHVIFTSGSTGRPKGVMIRHSSTVVLLRWLRENVSDAERASVLFSTSVNFDVSVAELFGTLAWGGTLVLVENALRLADVREPVVYASMVPTAAAELLRAGGIPRSVRTLNLGGEALPNELAQALYALGTVARVGNLYGPTEDTTYSTYSRVPKGADRVLVGRPVSNTRAYVLDRALAPAPVGAIGELYLAGDGLSRGYAGRPALTAERFLPDPYGAPGGRMYRVMDRVRWRAGGELEYFGRVDFQVKVRGFRIELGEIESRLAEHPAVRDAVVLAREDAAGDRRLVAYVTGEGADAEALRAHLAERLPEYMVPAAYVRLDAFPRTPNGKVDRKALPAPDAAAYATREYEAPVDEAEAAVAEIWAELLGIDRVGRRDHFFELGGHSLLAVQAASRIRQVLGVESALGELFERPVLADFARGVRDAGRAALPPIEPADRGGRIPLSFAQRRLWFLEQMGGLGSAYHIARRLRLRGELDRAALVRALDRIVARHEALRTTFAAEGGGEPEQRIASAGESAFRLVDHDLRGGADVEAELRRLAREEADAPFDLARGPLVRGRLARLADDDHVLLLTMHHVVSDGWSTGVLVDELSALYGAFREGRPDPLPPLPVQYADYAAWQRRWVDGEVLEAQARYWTETLGGAPERLELPADRPRPAKQDFDGASVGVELDEALTAALKALSRRSGTTLFMTLLAGWSVVLARLSGQDDVVVGTPTANRGRGEIERLIGFFVNTLALRVELGDRPTAAELLARVKRRALEAQAHQDIPFEQVVERIDPVRTLAHTPLFQVMFSWQNAPGGTLSLPGLRLGAVPAGPQRETAKFDLSLGLAERNGRIVGGMTYAAALFDRETMERHAGYLRRVLAAMAADEHRPVHALPLLADDERRLVVREWSAADARRSAADACLHVLFAARAARTPAAVALVSADGETTYAELDARANRLAHRLRALGAGPETAVGVCLDGRPELVVALLAVLKAGGVYVPLDPALPADRLAFMAEDAGIRVLVTRAALADRVSADVTVSVDDDAERIAAESAGAPASGVDPSGLAYVIYTSGSTGRPKGVAVPHGAAAAHLAAMAESLGIGAGDRVLQFASASFDVSLEQVFLPLLSGAAVVLRGPELWSPAELAARARALGVTVANLPPAYWQEVAAAADGSDALPGVRLLLVGGDALPPSAARAGGATRLLNAYGPTETVITASAFEVPADFAGAPVPIGRPLPGHTAYVLDALGAPAPRGAAGELYLGGVLARGYLRRAALTAERFVPDPFSADPGARLYRTGDRARWNARGELEFLGRADFQVKVRGFRIEPGEIEARLAEHTAVRDALVVAREDAAGDRRLVAYLTGEPVDAEALRSHLSTRLPEYMLPAAYVRLEAFPLNANGKVDRRALPAPEGDAFATRAYEAPRGATEEALAAIWSELLGVERVGRRDHFFELGGHSLLAVQVVSRVRQRIGAEVGIGDLFERPVLADFARPLDAAARADLPPITPAERGGPMALSFAQQRMWFLERMEGAGATFHIPTRTRLRGALDRPALIHALNRIVARHEALRTSFPEEDGVAAQRIAPEKAGFALVEHDLTAHPDAPREVGRIAAEEAAAPFDLAQGPLIRGRLVRVAEDDHVLLVTMHHIVSDGWSMGIFTRELGALYAAFRDGDPDPLPPLPVQYADYAAWQRRWMDGEVLRRQAAYWERTLAGAPERLEVPADRPRPARQDFAGASLPVVLGEELTAGLKALSQRHGTTLFMTVLAGWAAVLARLSGQDDVVVGTPSANRGRREIEGLIGFFVNLLAVRVDLSGAPTVAELLERVKARALGAQHHQDIPFEQVVDLVRPARSLSHGPLFQAMLTWQSTPGGGGAALPGLKTGSVGAARPDGGTREATATMDLSLTLSERGGRIAGSLVYATSLFDRETVERYLGYLRRALEAMAADEHRPVHALPLLAAGERRRVAAWSAAGPADTGVCIHALFEAQAGRTPDAAALLSADGEMTYGELDARANRLARHLRRLGVGPETAVGVCLDGRPELVVALLAVLKAGGVYVPLDPALPVERLAYMAGDAAIRVLVTRADLTDRVSAPVTVRIDDDEARIAAESADPPAFAVAPSGLAYVIYTSGSTGRPKGVAVPHGAAAAHFSAMADALGIARLDRVLQFASASFDVSLEQVFLPLLSGALLVLRGPEPWSPGEFAARARALGVTVANLPPAYWQEVAAAAGGGDALPGVRLLLVGGDALPPAAARTGGTTRLLNAYGPTEAVVTASAFRVPAGFAGTQVPIGRPLPAHTAHVLDALGAPMPQGVAGELYVGGVLARGYLGRAALTAERFVPDPFSSTPGARLYRTGDRARWNAHGNLEFLGRADFQLKVRGFRIEPGEIEARLAEHPAVRDALVVAREDAGGRRLVAYVTGEPVEADALRSHLSTRLPEYMLPAAYVRLDAFPLNANAKVDRAALPAPDADAFATRAYEAPLGETEEALAAVWSELLGVERIGRRDHFFALGGHSLLAVQVISRIRQSLGAEVGIGDLFERPVLAELARAVDSASRADLPPIVPVARGEALPLSFAQQRLWFLERMEGTGRIYHVPTRMRLRGALDRDALVRALDRVVARHEALRTTFPERDGVAAQRIAPETAGFALVEHDLAGHPDAPREAGRIAAEEEAAPFDLADGPLVRGRLVRLAEDDHVLLVTMHHVVSDGWSMGIFTRELGTLYAAFRDGEPDPLPPLPVQYADYAAWQRRWMEGEVLGRQAAYWEQTLAGAPELLEVPADRPRPTRQDFAGAVVPVAFDEALTAGLKALSQRHGTTLFMTLLAGWSVVLSRLAGQDDVVVGTPTANRGRREIEGLIGFFVNLLAVRVDLSGAPTAADLLGRVKARTLGAQHHQDIPFEQVVERVHPARSLSHGPLFQAMLAWQNAPGGGGPELPGLSAAPVGAPRTEGGAPEATATVDLSLALGERGGRIAGSLVYAAALFERETVERYLGYLRRVLAEMAADDRRAVHAIPLLADDERRLVGGWSAAGPARSAGAGIHALFEAQAARTPDAVALFSAGGAMTYGALDARANRLARRLRALGVRTETPVGVSLEWRPDLVVALLAVLKAGGVYVPLDPSLPAERLAYMAEDAGIRVLVTREALADRVSCSTTVRIDADAAAIAAERDDAPSAAVHPSALAYVIYTSGSTGRPKGVAVEHGAAAAHLSAMADALGVVRLDHVLQFASAGFDVSLEQVFLPLLSGAALVLRGPEPWSPDEFAARALTLGVDVANLPPAYWQEVAAAAGGGDPLPGVRLLLVGGDALPPAAAHAGRATRLLNGYGPTEAVITATTFSVPAGFAGASVPIGRPIAGHTAHVLDALGAPVPQGVAGELCLGGVLARGYLGRPALTAERFVPDPFSSTPGARLYRTGDRARWNARGTLEFLGRADFQVKVRGFRIEPGEIEARLAEHPAVRGAVVVARGGAGGDRRLVAYVAAGAEVDAEALRAHLAPRLPDYMLPAAYVRLDAFPLNASGKVDRAALPAPEGDAYATRAYEAPADAVEEAVAAVWSELLGAGRIGRADHFFELGGHSLLAVRAVARLRGALGAAPSVGDLFERPVLADFARALRDRGECAAADAAVPVRPGGAEPPLFLVHDGMGSTAYARVLAPRIDPEVPVYALPAPRSEGGAPRTVEAMAARLVAMIRAVRPSGPYRLAGWSFGGLLAYEAAARLAAEGEAIEVVGMIDTHLASGPGGGDGEDGADLPLLIRTLRMRAGAAAWTDPAPRDPADGGADGGEGAELGAALGRARAAGLLPAGVTDEEAARVRDELRGYRAAARAYAPRPLSAPVVLFPAGEGRADPRRGWDAVLPGALRIAPVPGTHWSMMGPDHVAAVGRVLSREIRHAAGGGGAEAGRKLSGDGRIGEMGLPFPVPPT